DAQMHSAFRRVEIRLGLDSAERRLHRIIVRCSARALVVPMSQPAPKSFTTYRPAFAMPGNEDIRISNAVRRMNQLGGGCEFDQNVRRFCCFCGLLGLFLKRMPNPPQLAPIVAVALFTHPFPDAGIGV